VASISLPKAALAVFHYLVHFVVILFHRYVIFKALLLLLLLLLLSVFEDAP